MRTIYKPVVNVLYTIDAIDAIAVIHVIEQIGIPTVQFMTLVSLLYDTLSGPPGWRIMQEWLEWDAGGNEIA